MSCHRNSRMSSSAPGGATAGYSPWGRRDCGQWRPFEIGLIVFSFLIFWPIGLALLMWKLWSRSQGYEGDVFAFAQEQSARVKEVFGGAAQDATRGWGGPAFMRTTGNVAFDEWREGELARLEEERRKLAEAERDFAEHIDQLRRARDREEFDSFMRNRKGGEGAGA